MPLADILALVRDEVRAAGVVQVYTYLPIMVAGAQIPNTLKDDGRLHFWSVTRESTSEARLTNQETLRQHGLVIRGNYEIQDSRLSEPAFQTLVERIMARFRARYSLPFPASVERLGPAQASQIGPRVLAETYLVHYVELRLEAQELVSP